MDIAPPPAAALPATTLFGNQSAEDQYEILLRFQAASDECYHQKRASCKSEDEHEILRRLLPSRSVRSSPPATPWTVHRPIDFSENTSDVEGPETDVGDASRARPCATHRLLSNPQPTSQTKTKPVFLNTIRRTVIYVHELWRPAGARKKIKIKKS